MVQGGVSPEKDRCTPSFILFILYTCARLQRNVWPQLITSRKTSATYDPHTHTCRAISRHEDRGVTHYILYTALLCFLRYPIQSTLHVYSSKQVLLISSSGARGARCIDQPCVHGLMYNPIASTKAPTRAKKPTILPSRTGMRKGVPLAVPYVFLSPLEVTILRDVTMWSVPNLPVVPEISVT